MPSPLHEPNGPGHPVVLFDGACNLCNASVDYIIGRDRRGLFRFASLQGEIGRDLLHRFHAPAGDADTVILIEDGRVYTRSTAALRIARRLSFPWFLLAVFLLVPACIRDPVYDLIARHRHRWFGRTEACRLPPDELRDRFLDEP